MPLEFSGKKFDLLSPVSGLRSFLSFRPLPGDLLLPGEEFPKPQKQRDVHRDKIITKTEKFVLDPDPAQHLAETGAQIKHTLPKQCHPVKIIIINQDKIADKRQDQKERHKPAQSFAPDLAPK